MTPKTGRRILGGLFVAGGLSMLAQEAPPPQQVITDFLLVIAGLVLFFWGFWRKPQL